MPSHYLGFLRVIINVFSSYCPDSYIVLCSSPSVCTLNLDCFIYFQGFSFTPLKYPKHAQIYNLRAAPLRGLRLGHPATYQLDSSTSAGTHCI